MNVNDQTYRPLFKGSPLLYKKIKPLYFFSNTKEIQKETQTARETLSQRQQLSLLVKYAVCVPRPLGQLALVRDLGVAGVRAARCQQSSAVVVALHDA